MKTQDIYIWLEDLAEYLKVRHPNLPDDLEVYRVTMADHFGAVKCIVRSEVFPDIETCYPRRDVVYQAGEPFEIYVHE